MRENGAHAGKQEDVKAKIRARYKGVDRSELEFIPARPREKLFEDTAQKRVCAYCRVSTDDPNQTSSYELQKNHYEDFIKEHEGWIFAGIYADEGISGTSMQHRDECIRMIGDAKAGKFDLIITKSVSRLARNIVDCIRTVRELAGLNPPVGVFFETEHIYTLDNISEMMLAVLSAAAQEESHTKSEIMNISVEQRFSRGIFLTPELLGYDVDGNLVINEEEAITVKLCYYLLLGGFAPPEIAEILMELKRPTKLGNYKWTGGSVVDIIRNERRCGDVLARKTFTPNYLDHKSKKNNHDRNQYRQTDHHEGIVSHEVYNACQKILDGYKFTKNAGTVPNLQVIEDGVLRGFVPVNRNWRGFTDEDYAKASESAYGDGIAVEVDMGSDSAFLLEGYQVVRAEFFSTQNAPAMTIRDGKINFNTACIRKFEKREYVELLYNPVEGCIAVRPCPSSNPNAIRWSSVRDGRIAVLPKSCRGFLTPLFAGRGWEDGFRYRFRGQYRHQGDGDVLLFDLSEPEILAEYSEVMQRNNPDGCDKNPAEEEDGCVCESGVGADESHSEPGPVSDRPTCPEGKPAETEMGVQPVPVKKSTYLILYPAGWRGRFGTDADKHGVTVFRRFRHMGDWEILRPAKNVEGMEIVSPELVDRLMEEAQGMIDRIKIAG